ncbi:MAG TPA: hypothetical protein VHY30_10375 [Verrucomicrobiae bacterium]|jgi:hypothetical protein|nr:hypothetical protein [Verrucomicrobiae bacterium]
MNSAAPILPLKNKLIRRPLWKMKSVGDFLDLEYEQVMAHIQSGGLLWAFNIATRGSRIEPRVLAHCAVEKKMGEIAETGAMRKLTLGKVINLILPPRNIRSTELKRILSCSSCHIYALAKNNFKIVRKATAKDGPDSYTVFQRASVEKFLEKRRMI